MPSSARRIAGAITSASDMVPYRRSANARPATVPGTPAERWLKRASFLSTAPVPSRNMSRPAAAGAVSR